MSKLNLDISKYSCNELHDIFNIEKNSNLEQVQSQLHKYKNNILADGNLNLEEKDNIANFLNNVVEKLTDSLDFSASSNNLVSGSSMNHPIIQNPNVLAGLNAKIYEGRNVKSTHFPPGYINPINIKTIKKTINIDTSFRDSYYATKSSDFHVNLPESFKKVVSMRLTSFILPTSIYAISKHRGNNNFSYSDTSSVILDDGNYSVLSNNSHNTIDDVNIVNAINKKLNADSSTISYSIDPVNGKSKFTNTNKFTLNFNMDSSNNYDLDNPLPLKLGWLLGFRAGTYESTSSSYEIISEGVCAITGPKYIYICINDFTNAGNNNFTAAFSSSTLSPHIIARINYQSLVQQNGHYSFAQEDDFNDPINRSREYFGPVDIQKFHFQILDEYGQVVDFNGMDWSCALTFDILYD